MLKRIALIISLWLVALPAVSLTHFFAFPIGFLAVALLLFSSAWLKFPSENAS